MSPVEIVALLALTGYAVDRQTQGHEVTGSGRFTLAIVYAIVGLARGRLSRMWAETDDGGRHVCTQGTPLTIALFVGLVAVEFAMGTAAYFLHVSDDGGVGEVLVMIAIMVAFQAEYVWRRAQAMDAAAVPVAR